jgi:hypothetical protein
MSQTHCIILLHFVVMQFQIPLMHINVGYKSCLVKNLICTYMYVRFQRHQCILNFKNYSFFSFCAWNGVGNLKVIFFGNNGPNRCYSHDFQLDHVYFKKLKNKIIESTMYYNESFGKVKLYLYVNKLSSVMKWHGFFDSWCIFIQTLSNILRNFYKHINICVCVCVCVCKM